MADILYIHTYIFGMMNGYYVNVLFEQENVRYHMINESNGSLLGSTPERGPSCTDLGSPNEEESSYDAAYYS